MKGNTDELVDLALHSLVLLMLLSVKAILRRSNAKRMFSCFDNKPLHGTPSQDYDMQIKNVVFCDLSSLHILMLNRS